MHAQEIAESWQARALRKADGPMFGVLLSVLAHSFDDAMPILLRVVFPGFTSIQAPFLCSAGKIAKSGHVMADMVTKDGQIVKNQALFMNTRTMERAFRKLADALSLSDEERIAMFAAAKAWVVCDYRLDPNMDPADPEARRLVLH